MLKRDFSAIREEIIWVKRYNGVRVITGRVITGYDHCTCNSNKGCCSFGRCSRFGCGLYAKEVNLTEIIHAKYISRSYSTYFWINHKIDFSHRGPLRA